MKKNIIIIVVTLGILLIIGVAYFYENPIITTNGVMYPEAVSMLKTNVTGAIFYCRNTSLDRGEGGGACFAEISCVAYKTGKDKVRELCETMIRTRNLPQSEDEVREETHLCAHEISIVCGNDKNNAIKLCESVEHRENCLVVLAMTIANRDLLGATKACKKTVSIRKDECYYNILYTAIKRKKIDEGLEVCEIYGEDATKFGREINMSEFFASRKSYCELFIATHISKTKPEKARKICENILEPEIKEICLDSI